MPKSFDLIDPLRCIQATASYQISQLLKNLWRISHAKGDLVLAMGDLELAKGDLEQTTSSQLGNPGYHCATLQQQQQLQPKQGDRTPVVD